LQNLSNIQFVIIGIAFAIVLLVSLIVGGRGGGRGAADTSRPGWVSEGQVVQRPKAEGYHTWKIEDDGRYKLQVTTPDGYKEKLYVNPESGVRFSATADDDDND
jgi:Peptidase propeptide and YPEB domain